MENGFQIFDFLLHIDQYIFCWAESHYLWIFILLFTIVFCETGLLFMAFLPGDMLLFAAGTTIATVNDSWSHIISCALSLIIAAILGNLLNYRIGRIIGEKVFQHPYRFIHLKYLDKTREYYDKYGMKTIVLARFIPLVRTFAPFVAGAARMNPGKYRQYTVIGSILWITIFLIGGYFFGNIPIVRNHFSMIMLSILILSGVPLMIELITSVIKSRHHGRMTNNDGNF